MKRFVAAAAAASVLALLVAIPVVFAAQLSGGCILQVRSLTGPAATGSTIDQGEARGPIAEGDVGSQSHPFKVSPDGSVDFLFTTPQVFVNNHWAIYAAGLPYAILQGQDDNPLDVDETGVVDLSKTMSAFPFKLVGTIPVSGDLWGNNDTSHCYGEGYVQVIGDPVGTIPWDVAVALLIIAGLGLLFVTPYTMNWEVDKLGGERLHTGPLTDEPPTGG
jgi:hypothetical protein